jgi:hypothetical protein
MAGNEYAHITALDAPCLRCHWKAMLADSIEEERYLTRLVKTPAGEIMRDLARQDVVEARRQLETVCVVHGVGCRRNRNGGSSS